MEWLPITTSSVGCGLHLPKKFVGWCMDDGSEVAMYGGWSGAYL